MTHSLSTHPLARYHLRALDEDSKKPTVAAIAMVAKLSSGIDSVGWLLHCRTKVKMGWAAQSRRRSGSAVRLLLSDVPTLDPLYLGVEPTEMPQRRVHW